MLDLLIKDGQVVDGTGRPAFCADVGIESGRIVRIGKIDADSAERIIDARGLSVAPGFIDIHSHSDLVFALGHERQAELLGGRIRQGITTEIVGNCGMGVAPVDRFSMPVLETMFSFLSPEGIEWNWSSVGEYLSRLERQGVVLNVGTLVPHGPIRVTAVGMRMAFHQRQAENGFRRMEGLIALSLEEGAFGMSFGLIYPPGQFSTTGELVRLSKKVGEHGGFVAFHQRGGGKETLSDSVKEIIQVGKEARVPVHHSHEMSHGRGDWSAIERTLELKEKAWKEGIEITQDMFPYTSVCTTMLAIYPPWSLEGGIPGLLEKLQDPSARERIRRDIEEVVPCWPPWAERGWPVNIVRDFGWDNIYVSFVTREENKRYEMKSVSRIAQMTGKDPFNAVSDLVIDEGGTVTQLIFGISGDNTTDEPLKELMRLPSRIFITDAWEIGRGTPHPGAYGAYPKILGRYVRDERVLSLEEAILRMTSLPAGRLGLKDRGMIKEDACADLTIFNSERVVDRSTHEKPQRYAEGIEFVIINGVPVVEHGEYTNKVAGQVLRRV